MYVKLFEKYNNDNEIFEILRSTYFKSPATILNIKQTNGYEIKNNKASFGATYTYNDADPYYLMHEMGHFVTIMNYGRLLKPHYGLEYTTKVKVNDVDYDLPLTWNGIKNELKAVMFQEVLALHYTNKMPLKQWVRSFQLMEDFTNVPPDNTIKDENGNYIDIDTKKKIPYDQMKERRFNTIYQYYDRMKEENKSLLNINEFNKRWVERIEYLEDNLN
jgi:hypothetical protein